MSTEPANIPQEMWDAIVAADAEHRLHVRRVEYESRVAEDERARDAILEIGKRHGFSEAAMIRRCLVAPRPNDTSEGCMKGGHRTK